MRNLISALRNICSALWLAYHWKDLLQSTRDAIFADICRIRHVRTKKGE